MTSVMNVLLLAPAVCMNIETYFLSCEYTCTGTIPNYCCLTLINLLLRKQQVYNLQHLLPSVLCLGAC